MKCVLIMNDNTTELSSLGDRALKSVYTSYLQPTTKLSKPWIFGLVIYISIVVSLGTIKICYKEPSCIST